MRDDIYGSMYRRHGWLWFLPVEGRDIRERESRLRMAFQFHCFVHFIDRFGDRFLFPIHIALRSSFDKLYPGKRPELLCRA